MNVALASPSDEIAAINKSQTSIERLCVVRNIFKFGRKMDKPNDGTLRMSLLHPSGCLRQLLQAFGVDAALSVTGKRLLVTVGRTRKTKIRGDEYNDRITIIWERRDQDAAQTGSPWRIEVRVELNTSRLSSRHRPLISVMIARQQNDWFFRAAKRWPAAI